MEFADVVRTRTMTRSFSTEPVDRALLVELVELSSRAPSAGKSQGFNLVVFEGEETSRFWDVTLPHEERAGFAWPKLLHAPVIALVCADPRAYLERYSEADKQHTGLGASQEAWPAPFWTIDAAFAAMVLLGAAHDVGLGSLFFALSRGEDTLRERCAIPSEVEILGVVALGWPSEDGARKGRSASRPRRDASSILRFSSW
jgi:nitroreductase